MLVSIGTIRVNAARLGESPCDFRTCMHTHTHACMYERTYACVHACTYVTCQRAYVRVLLRASATIHTDCSATEKVDIDDDRSLAPPLEETRARTRIHARIRSGARVKARHIRREVDLA